MTPGKTAPAVIVAAIVVALTTYGLIVVGPVATLIIGGSATLAFVAWLLTTFKTPADPDRILVPYLLLVGAELIHMSEEAITDFP